MRRFQSRAGFTGHLAFVCESDTEFVQRKFQSRAGFTGHLDKCGEHLFADVFGVVSIPSGLHRPFRQINVATSTA